MLHLKQLEAITETELKALISAQVREGQMIDYKREINLKPIKAKLELVRDISSFANASGGDLVFGISEADGLPLEVLGIEPTDFEELEAQILQSCRSHLDPAVNGIRTRAIPLTNGGYVSVVRIPKTWNAPHMVMMECENKCWTRDQSGKRGMDILDLRQAMAYSDGVAQRMKRFRTERVASAIVHGRTLYADVHMSKREWRRELELGN